MSKIGAVPGWWLSMTGVLDARALLGLLHEVERLGIPKNDRAGVMAVWRRMRVDQALQQLGERA